MKSKTKLSTAILIGSAVIGATNCEAQVEKDSLELSNNPNKENQLQKTFPIIKKDSIELEKRLKELSETEYKGELRGGAMCYMPMYINDRPYTCPVCNTIRMVSAFDAIAIDTIRVKVQKIKDIGYDVILDEKEFCEHCNGKNAKEPVLIFKIRYSKNSKYHIVKSNFDQEYECLLQFLLGNDTYKGDGHDKYSIHNNLDIVKKMSGLGKKVKLHKHYYDGFTGLYLNKKEYKESQENFKKMLEESSKENKDKEQQK